MLVLQLTTILVNVVKFTYPKGEKLLIIHNYLDQKQSEYTY